MPAARLLFMGSQCLHHASEPGMIPHRRSTVDWSDCLTTGIEPLLILLLIDSTARCTGEHDGCHRRAGRFLTNFPLLYCVYMGVSVWFLLHSIFVDTSLL